MSNAKPTMETYIEMSPRVFEENLTRADALVGGLVERYARRGLRDLRFVASDPRTPVWPRAPSPSASWAFGWTSSPRRAISMNSSAWMSWRPMRSRSLSRRAVAARTSSRRCAPRARGGTRRWPSRATSRPTCATRLTLIFEYGVGNETVGFVTMGVLTLMEFIALFSLATAEALGDRR